MNVVENKSGANLRPLHYWRLWLFDTVLVGAGFWFYLATHYGTNDFFGKACAMALLPLIPVMVLVGGAGSTVFALTKVLIEKRSLARPAALALLVGPALALTLVLGLSAVFKSPAHRLSYICVGHAPTSASQVKITGYSTFLREEWLAVFRVDQSGFEKFVAEAKLVPADNFEFSKTIGSSALKATRIFQDAPAIGEALCFRRVFNEPVEHERGRVYAMYDPAASTAVVLREYSD